jgi:ribosome maturation factor RimP
MNVNFDVNQLFAICEPAAAGIGYDIVDIEFRRESQGWVLRVFIDRLAGTVDAEGASGVGLADCERASRELSAVLDASDPIDVAYHLEVSSPGIERPLRRETDYARFAGQRARLRLKDPMETVGGPRKNFTGTVVGAVDGRLAIECDGLEFDFPLDLVAKANLEIADDVLLGAAPSRDRDKAGGRRGPKAARGGHDAEATSPAKQLRR